MSFMPPSDRRREVSGWYDHDGVPDASDRADYTALQRESGLPVRQFNGEARRWLVEQYGYVRWSHRDWLEAARAIVRRVAREREEAARESRAAWSSVGDVLPGARERFARGGFWR